MSNWPSSYDEISDVENSLSVHNPKKPLPLGFGFFGGALLGVMITPMTCSFFN